jgi:hypothetical protein
MTGGEDGALAAGTEAEVLTSSPTDAAWDAACVERFADAKRWGATCRDG